MSRSPSPAGKIAFHALILLAYGASAVVLTYPIAFRALDDIPDHDIDARTAVWTQWWFRQAAAGPESLDHTSYLFHPEGLDLTGHSHSPLPSAVAALLFPFVGEIGAFNLTMLLIFPLGGWGMYLLAHDLTRRRDASFVAGWIWAFAPYHLTQALAHPNLASVQWIPFQVLFLRRALAGGGWLPAVMAGVFFALTVACGLQLGVLAGLAALVGVLAALVTREGSRSKRVVAHVGLAALVAIVLAAPMVVPLLDAWRAQERPERLLVSEKLTGQTDALAYLVPPRYHPWLGRLATPVYERFRKNRQWMPYLGFVPLGLAVFAAIRVRKARPWLLAGVGLVICALGARLRVGGGVLEAVPLPYALVDDWLPFAALRSSDRFNLLLPLCLAAAVALALARSRRSWPVAVAGILIAFEFLCAPVPTTKAYPDSVLTERLRDSEDRSALLNLPMGRQPSKHWMLLQTAHGRPIVEGLAARTPPEAYDFIRGFPLLRYLALPDAPEPPDVRDEIGRLADAGVGHVVIHLEHASEEELERWLRVLGDRPSFRDEHFIVYETSAPERNRERFRRD